MASRGRIHASFRVKVNAAICIGLCVLILLGVVARQSIEESYRSGQEVQRMLAVEGHLDAIRLDVELAEAAQLEYQLTGDAAKSDEFQAITRRVRRALDELGKVLIVPDQIDRFAVLERAVSVRFEVLGEAIRLRGAGGSAAALLLGGSSAESGKEIAVINDAIDWRERQMIGDQSENARTHAEMAAKVTFWGAALAIVLLVWMIFIINRYEGARRRDEGELRSAQERLALALEGSNSAVWDWDLRREEIYLSEDWRRMLGAQARASVVTPAQLLDLVHPDDLDHVQKSVQGALTGAMPDYREEHRVKRVNGEWIWVLSRGKVVRRDAAGRPLRMAGTNQDVTEKKRVELALKEHDERLSLALDTAGMVSWDWDSISDEFTWQDSPQRLLGPVRGDGYLSLRDAVTHEDLVRYIRTLDDAVESGDAYRDEFRITRTDGCLIWVLACGRVERDARGKVARVIGVAQDISKFKESELALRASERELRLITDSVPAIISHTDCNERILFCNNALASLVGARPDDLVGRPLPALYGEEVYRMIQPYVRRALAGEKVRFQSTQTTRDRGVIDLDVTYIPRRGALGQVEGFYSLATDISEIKRLDRMKSEFVSTVSHELRTPLTSIRGSLGVLAGGVAGALPDKARTFIDIAKNNCERLIRLINDILDMEKIESGKMTFQLRVLNLMELVEQVVKANEGFAAQHKVRLQVIVSRPGSKVNGDSDRLAQVLTNLISNACKFSPAGSSVDIAVTGDGKRVRVSVVDHGPGISEEFRTRIFQKFSQADSSDVRQKGGTGLGLSISKAIVEHLGGEIGFETEAAKGTTFFFSLPEWREPFAVPLSASSDR